MRSSRSESRRRRRRPRLRRRAAVAVATGWVEAAQLRSSSPIVQEALAAGFVEHWRCRKLLAVRSSGGGFCRRCCLHGSRGVQDQDLRGGEPLPGLLRPPLLPQPLVGFVRQEGGTLTDMSRSLGALCGVPRRRGMSDRRPHECGCGGQRLGRLISCHHTVQVRHVFNA